MIDITEEESKIRQEALCDFISFIFRSGESFKKSYFKFMVLSWRLKPEFFSEHSESKLAKELGISRQRLNYHSQKIAEDLGYEVHYKCKESRERCAKAQAGNTNRKTSKDNSKIWSKPLL